MKEKKKQDKIFEKEYILSQFKFDAKVAEVFDDMVSRSVPLYKETMKAVINLAQTFVKEIHQYMILDVQLAHSYLNVKKFSIKSQSNIVE